MKGMNYIPHAEVEQIGTPSARTLLYRRLPVGRPWTPDTCCPPIHNEGMSPHFQPVGGDAPKMETANFASDVSYIIGTRVGLGAGRRNADLQSAVSPICNRQPDQVHQPRQILRLTFHIYNRDQCWSQCWPPRPTPGPPRFAGPVKKVSTFFTFVGQATPFVAQ
jgi:hypothetical protein